MGAQGPRRFEEGVDGGRCEHTVRPCSSVLRGRKAGSAHCLDCMQDCNFSDLTARDPTRGAIRRSMHAAEVSPPCRGKWT